MALSFVCPHCRSNENAAEQYAGMTVPCKSCGQMIAVPYPQGMSSGAKVATGVGVGTVLMIVGAVMLVMLLGCGGVAVALLLPAVQAARTAARDAQSMNNMKQIMLAMHNYHQTYNTFPPAYIADKDGKPMTSWRVLILPFIEQQGLADQYDPTKPWDSPENLAVAEFIPQVYRSAAEPSTPQNRNHTSYMFLTGKGTAFDGGRGTSIASITDGTSNTICLVEVAQSETPWTKPTDLDVAQLDFIIRDAKNAQPGQLNAVTRGSLKVGMFDGSVRRIPQSTPPDVLKASAGSADAIPVMLP